MNWYLEWDMDGMQWEVTRIDLYEYQNSDNGKNGTYHECFLFIYNHLRNITFSHLDTMPDCFMHCTEGTFKLTEQDVITALKDYCPEELI